MEKYPLSKTVTDFVSTFTNSRYKSWEHCFLFFENEVYKKDITEKTLDHASLHLAFYLASWGMMRGSTFLLQSDYKVHKDLIERVLLNPIYEPLWNFNFLNPSKAEIDNYLSLLFDKTSGIIYQVTNAYTYNSQGEIGKPTDTLITKILMGTLGCTPAYDRYFMEGIAYVQNNSKEDIKFVQRLSPDSLKALVEFVNRNKDELCFLNKKLDMEYPIMKLIDMYFWTIGLNEEIERKKNNKSVINLLEV